MRVDREKRGVEYEIADRGAKEAGAKVLIFSDQHVSGQQLKQLSGVAALLRFPLPLDELGLEDDEEYDDEEDEAEGEEVEDGGGGELSGATSALAVS